MNRANENPYAVAGNATDAPRSKHQPQHSEHVLTAKIFLVSVIMGAIAFTVTANVVRAYTVSFPFWLAAIPGAMTGAAFSPLTYTFIHEKPLYLAGATLATVVTMAGVITAVFHPFLSLVVLFSAYIITGFLILAFFPTRHTMHDPSRCSTCGYLLTGLPTTICPECGANTRATNDT